MKNIKSINMVIISALLSIIFILLTVYYHQFFVYPFILFFYICANLISYETNFYEYKETEQKIDYDDYFTERKYTFFRDFLFICAYATIKHIQEEKQKKINYRTACMQKLNNQAEDIDYEDVTTEKPYEKAPPHGQG